MLQSTVNIIKLSLYNIFCTPQNKPSKEADFFMDFDKLKFKEQLEKENEERYKLQADNIAILQEYKKQIQKLYSISPQNASILQFEAINNNIAEKQDKLYNTLNNERNKLYLKEVNKFLIDIQNFARKLLTPFYLSPLQSYICELFADGTLKEALSFYYTFTKQALELKLSESAQILIIKKAIYKYFIKEEVFTGERGQKELEALYKDHVAITHAEQLKTENKHSENLSNEQIIKQALDYYKERKEKEEKELTKRKTDKRQNQYKTNDDLDIIISNNANNAFFYCNGKNTTSQAGTGKFKDYQVIRINPQTTHPTVIIFNCNKPVEIKPIYGQMWDFILQVIYKHIRKQIKEIIEAYDNKTNLDKEIRTITGSLNEFTALKIPANSKYFAQYRTKMKNDWKNFCDILKICGIEARYKNYKKERKWEPFWGGLFESFSINDNFEFKAILTDDYTKYNALTFSKMSSPLESFQNADLVHYPYIYNLHKCFYIFNRINKNEIRDITVKTLIEWLGYDIEELRKQEKISLLPEKSYNYLNELVNKFDMYFLFDNQNLETLKNYKWTSKRIKKDCLQEFLEKKIFFSFGEKKKKKKKNYKAKSPIEYYKDYLKEKKNKTI